MILTNSKERTRFFRFAIVGTIGALVDFLIFNLLTSVVKLIPVWSSVFSFSVAVVSNFLLNRYWTYPDSRSKSVTRQIVQFVVVSLMGLGIRTPLFAWLEKVLVRFFTGFPIHLPLTPTFWGHNVSLAIAIIVVMFWNYFANRFWTYSDVRVSSVHSS